MVAPSPIHTSCPTCGKPIAIVFDRARTGARERTIVRCPHVVEGVPCKGVIEGMFPPDTRAVPIPAASG
jgi:hypothetical protein